MIKIYKNPNGDTRTAPKDVTFEEFQKSNDMHINDVREVMHEISDMIYERGNNHDFTKKTEEVMFYNNFISTLNHGTDFVNDEWYKLHINTERHHLFSRCPDDVNLIDVLEMISDCVCAGMSRSGVIRDLEINTDIINKAIQNTVNLIKDMIEVCDKED